MSGLKHRFGLWLHRGLVRVGLLKDPWRGKRAQSAHETPEEST